MNLDARLREQLSEATYKDSEGNTQKVNPELITVKYDAESKPSISFEPRTPRAMIDAAKSHFKKFDPNRVSAAEKVDIAKAELAASDYRAVRAAEGEPMKMSWVEYRAGLRAVIRAGGKGIDLPEKPV